MTYFTSVSLKNYIHNGTHNQIDEDDKAIHRDLGVSTCMGHDKKMLH
jgi:hypothetical protein